MESINTARKTNDYVGSSLTFLCSHTYTGYQSKLLSDEDMSLVLNNDALISRELCSNSFSKLMSLTKTYAASYASINSNSASLTPSGLEAA